MTEEKPASRRVRQTIHFHFDGTREELIEAFRQSIAENFGEDRVEEIMAQQDWYEPPKLKGEGVEK